MPRLHNSIWVWGLNYVQLWKSSGWIKAGTFATSTNKCVLKMYSKDVYTACSNAVWIFGLEFLQSNNLGCWLWQGVLEAPKPPLLKMLLGYYKLYKLYKGLRAESASAVTGRQCPHSGEGKDFLSCQPGFLLRKLLYLGKSKNLPQGGK